MDTLQCAVVLAKLERFDWEVEQRLKIGARYNKLLAGKVQVVTQRSDRTSGFAQYTVLIENREQVQEKLKAAGIPTAVHYRIPLNPNFEHLIRPQPSVDGGFGRFLGPVCSHVIESICVDFSF